VELLVDHLEHRDARLGVLGEHDVEERAQAAHLRRGEEAHGRGLGRPALHHLPRELIPVGGLGEHVVVGVAPVHLRGAPGALAGQFLGAGGGAAVALGEVVDVTEGAGHVNPPGA